MAVRLAAVIVRRGGVLLLDAVDWEVGEGECWAVLGPNGAGKSTLLGLLTGGTWATSGSVEVLGHRLGRVDVRELRRRVPLVSHRLADQLHDHHTVRELLAASRRGALAPGLEERALGDEAGVADVAGRLGLGGLLDRRWGRCSQGERQRVLLGRALLGIGHAGAPGVLLLDEATSGLDLPGRELLLDLVERTTTVPGVEVRATVVVAHHLEDLPATTTHALLLARGRVVAAGPADEVLLGPALSETFDLAVSARRTSTGRFTAEVVRR